jgi:phycobilisome linker polypeptide/EF hand domain-containing protein
MLRVAVFASALTVIPCIAAAQQPCTADARQVVEQAYRQVLERSADPASSASVDALSRGTTVRELVRGLAKSSEHLQRFGSQASRENAVVDVYRHLLNRGPDPEGLRNAVNLVNRRGIVPLIDQIMDSPEYRQQYGDWTVPGSNIRYCANGERPGQQQSSNAPGNGNTMRFRRMDTNNDGQIQRSEWRGNPQSFSNFDWNNDGVLSGEEVSVASARRGNRNRGEDFEVGDNDRFDYLDINGNGFIERNEWDGGQNAFDRLDTSGDRRLTRAEFDSNARGTDFGRVDMNGDGRIRLNEWPWSHSAFDRQDTNGDGAITQNEYRGAPAERR